MNALYVWVIVVLQELLLIAEYLSEGKLSDWLMDDGVSHKGKEEKKRPETGLMAIRMRIALNLLRQLITIQDEIEKTLNSGAREISAPSFLRSEERRVGTECLE